MCSSGMMLLGAVAISSRCCLIPAAPACPFSLKEQNKQRICPDQRAPESPLIKAARRGNDSEVIDKNDSALPFFRNSLQTPMKIYILSHKQGFIVAVHREENISPAKLSCALRNSC